MKLTGLKIRPIATDWMRFIEPTSGRIMIDGSVGENIAYGRYEASALKYSIVGFKPSTSVTPGSQPSSVLACVMSGCL